MAQAAARQGRVSEEAIWPLMHCHEHRTEHGAKCRHRDCRIYRATKRSKIATPDGYRMVQMLAVLKTCLESSALEQRLAALEAQADIGTVEHFRPRVVS